MTDLDRVQAPTVSNMDSELDAEAVVRNFRITASDGRNHETKHYNVSATIAVRYKVNTERPVQDRLFESDFDRLVGETRRLAADAEPAAPKKAGKGRKKS